MSLRDDEVVLAINSGSSSLKAGFFVRDGADEREVLRCSADGIGRADGSLRVVDAEGHELLHEEKSHATQEEALGAFVAAAAERGVKPSAVTHRVVHGGPELTEHQLITPQVLEKLRAAEHFAPLHIPQALKLIAEAEKQFPALPQVACFDTAFHNTMPESAKRFALPGELYRRGVRRYGFHGLSYESIVHQLAGQMPERMVVAHLGNGASLCAMRGGVSVDTTMGLTPTGGIPMATRSGDLDPGVVLFLMRTEQMGADALEEMLNHRSGLVALSGGESDMKRLQERSDAGEAGAALAVTVFVTAVRKMVGAYAALLGGIDLLVFSGGIGEHGEAVRREVCEGLEFMGLRVDGAKVRVIPAQEEIQMARISRRVLA
ncbi:acetate/propionate family kinase [Granulicella sp. 5B5]|uniref:acetate/propionate family kinase n=1 Tax=Granulicella sp. 5B5 TaxID=1617967 RepID=UPI0015F3854C|nr:acetate/propionate family kinase [Granulicella sp. 5B5]QMV17437.1 acetate/propionate family kinase [Granulicella sp. 5B5]